MATNVQWKGTSKVVYTLDCTQSLSFLLVIERLERARCATARENGVSSSILPILRAAVPLARYRPSITVDEKRKGLRAVYVL